MSASADVAADRAASLRARVLAFYLPQFHPIPENDLWWGNGFTEWRNVASAQPLFRGHHQPRIPADLGFYDLRAPEVQAAQAALAVAHGIEGFCVWHYWFGGKRLLNRPVDQVLAQKDLDFPFCLAWANEPWSRRWLGEPRDVLQSQPYSPEDDADHAHWLADVFSDHRYLTVLGRPIFGIYAPGSLPDPRRTTDAIKHGVTATGLPEPYLVGIDAHSPGVDWRSAGFDAVLGFEPQLGWLPLALRDGPDPRRLLRNLRLGVPRARTKIYTEQEARRVFATNRPATVTHRSVMVGWDNTPRRGADGIVVTRTSPATFRSAMDDAVSWTERRHVPTERLVWVNAWNEWAEGNHLEPDLRHSRAYLQSVLAANSLPSPSTDRST